MFAFYFSGNHRYVETLCLPSLVATKTAETCHCGAAISPISPPTIMSNIDILSAMFLHLLFGKKVKEWPLNQCP